MINVMIIILGMIGNHMYMKIKPWRAISCRNLTHYRIFYHIVHIFQYSNQFHFDQGSICSLAWSCKVNSLYIYVIRALGFCLNGVYMLELLNTHESFQQQKSTWILSTHFDLENYRSVYQTYCHSFHGSYSYS